MSQDIYPQYHSLSHKFLEVQNKYINIDKIVSIDDVSDIAQGAYGWNINLSNNVTWPVLFKDKEDYDNQMAAFVNMFLIVRNPSIPYNDQRTPVFAALGMPQVTPPAGSYQKIIHPAIEAPVPPSE